jgi:hypothetical protein
MAAKIATHCFCNRGKPKNFFVHIRYCCLIYMPLKQRNQNIRARPLQAGAPGAGVPCRCTLTSRSAAAQPALQCPAGLRYAVAIFCEEISIFALIE